MVREAVLKSKDPKKLLEEIEKIDNIGKCTNSVQNHSVLLFFVWKITKSSNANGLFNIAALGEVIQSPEPEARD